MLCTSCSLRGWATTWKRPEPSKRASSARLSGVPVAVHPGDFGVVHVERHGVAEDDELEERRNEQQAAHARLAEQLDEFFAENDANSFPHGSRHLLIHFPRRHRQNT